MTELHIDGSLGALAVGARASVRGVTGSLHMPCSRDDLVQYYKTHFEQVTLLATYRDLFTKIGADFDRQVSFSEIPFRTNYEELPLLPHSGIGAWGKTFAHALNLSDDTEWRSLMFQARNLWITHHRALYLGNIENDDTSPLSTVSKLRKIIHPTFEGFVRSSIKNPRLRETLMNLRTPSHAQTTADGIVSIYLYATFGTYGIDWEACIQSIVSICESHGSQISWSSSPKPLFTTRDADYHITPSPRFGFGPHFELMNAELLALNIKRQN